MIAQIVLFRSFRQRNVYNNAWNKFISAIINLFWDTISLRKNILASKNGIRKCYIQDFSQLGEADILEIITTQK